jgi:hypothetical protein
MSTKQRRPKPSPPPTMQVIAEDAVSSMTARIDEGNALELPTRVDALEEAFRAVDEQAHLNSPWLRASVRFSVGMGIGAGIGIGLAYGLLNRALNGITGRHKGSRWARVSRRPS